MNIAFENMEVKFMNIIKLNKDDAILISKWNATEKSIDSLNDINEHLKNYGFLFNEFRLFVGDHWLYKVEVDKDVFSIKQINLENHVGNKFIYSFEEYNEQVFKEISNRIINREKCDYELYNFICVFNFVNYVIYKAMNQEMVLIEETERRYTKSNGSKAVSKKDKVYSLTDCVRKYARHINHCKHIFTCEHWEVRGHYRHYKSGKTVYIKPFEKGKNKDAELKDKVYTL
jgi:hypothetical protein